MNKINFFLIDVLISVKSSFKWKNQELSVFDFGISNDTLTKVEMFILNDLIKIEILLHFYVLSVSLFFSISSFLLFRLFAFSSK